MTEETKNMKTTRERGERKDNDRKDDNRNKTMEDETQRLMGVMANTRDREQEQKQRGRKRKHNRRKPCRQKDVGGCIPCLVHDKAFSGCLPAGCHHCKNKEGLHCSGKDDDSGNAHIYTKAHIL